MTKAQLFDSVRLLVDVEGVDGELIPAGARGAVVDVHTTPEEGYEVDVTIEPTDGGDSVSHWVTVDADQIEVVI